MPPKEKTYIIKKCGFSSDLVFGQMQRCIEVGKYLKEHEIDSEPNSITYEFVPQAFTTAYVNAWKNLDENNYLIIEEINRGNCAQIFGDIFQLLDRDSETGYSSYKITPDKDLQNYLAIALKDCDIEDDDIKSGEKMQLPSNLNILATMNTSDQSLFPIDSAFKRRWDWKYIPIDYTDNGHYITCGSDKYKWTDFLETVNARIESVTQSEDKKMGGWFVKPNGKEITADKFVSKVVFYLWNDVFKDLCHDGNSIFKEGFNKFHKFFDFKGDVKFDVLEEFLMSLGLTPLNSDDLSINQDNIGIESIDNPSRNNSSKFYYELSGKTVDGIGEVVRTVINELCLTMNYENILKDFQLIVNKTYNGDSAIRLGTAQDLGPDKKGRVRWWKDPFTSKDGKIFSVISLWNDDTYEKVKNFVDNYPNIFPGGLIQKSRV